MGLLVMILGLVLFLGVHTLTTQRELRARLIASMGEGGYKIGYALVSVAGLALIVWGFAALSRDRLDRRLVSADGVQAHHRGADAARGHPGGGVLYPRPDLHHAEASDAGRRQVVGGGASARQWRSRLDHPVRLVSGWAVFDRISLKRRADAGAPPIPVGGPGNDLIAIAVGVVAYLALAFAFHPVVIGVPVVGA